MNWMDGQVVAEGRVRVGTTLLDCNSRLYKTGSVVRVGIRLGSDPADRRGGAMLRARIETLQFHVRGHAGAAALRGAGRWHRCESRRGVDARDSQRRSPPVSVKGEVRGLEIARRSAPAFRRAVVDAESRVSLVFDQGIAGTSGAVAAPDGTPPRIVGAARTAGRRTRKR